MKVSELPVTLLLVGGGSVIQMDALDGVSACMIPPHHDSANAVGAAIAKVAGEVDIVEVLANRDEKSVLDEAKRKAVEVAVARGAERDDVKIVEVDQIPLQYVTNKATRLVIKAVGKLAPPDSDHTISAAQVIDEHDNDEIGVLEEHQVGATNTSSTINHAAYIDIEAYPPDIRHEVWYLSAVGLELISTGTSVLGTGGGSSRLQYLHSLEYLRNAKYQGRMRVIAPESLADLDVCVFGVWYGAPSVSSERIPAGHRGKWIGGGNGLASFPSGVHYDIPVVDEDLMGRAYSSLEHGTTCVHGYPVVPCVAADGKGNTAAVMQAESHRGAESMLRSQCADLGLKVAASCTPLTGDVIKQYVIPNTVSQAWYIGRAIHQARKSKKNIIQAIFDKTPGKVLYTGKVTHVQRDISKGYTVGQCTIEPFQSDEIDEPWQHPDIANEERHLVVPLQNEFLYAGYADAAHPDAELDVICTVPDLISILGPDGEAIGSPELRYGLKVSVIAMAARPLWTGENGLRVGGPEGFGLDMPWKKLGEYQKPRSVVADFA